MATSFRRQSLAAPPYKPRLMDDIQLSLTMTFTPDPVLRNARASSMSLDMTFSTIDPTDFDKDLARKALIRMEQRTVDASEWLTEQASHYGSIKD